MNAIQLEDEDWAVRQDRWRDTNLGDQSSLSELRPGEAFRFRKEPIYENIPML